MKNSKALCRLRNTYIKHLSLKLKSVCENCKLMLYCHCLNHKDRNFTQLDARTGSQIILGQ